MKNIMISMMVALVMPLVVSTVGTHAEERQYPKELLVWREEILNYVDLAKEILPKGPTATENAQKMKDLQANGERVARAYFDVKDENNRKVLDGFLAQTLNDNKDVQEYFVFFGNAFVKVAQEFLDDQKVHEHKIVRLSTTAGIVVGLLVGGGWIYLKSKAGLTGADLLIGATAVAVVSGVGLVGGVIAAHKIPVDRSVKNAQDFGVRYKHGIDFINDLQKMSPDLALLMSVQ